MALVGTLPREQFAAIAHLRWRIFANGLRSRRGKAEAVSGIMTVFLLAVFGFGPAIGFAFATYFAASTGTFSYFPVLLWTTFLFWQFFPAISVSITDTFDVSTLLRFPISLPNYYILWLAYGSLDPTLIVAGLWLFGMFVGFLFGNPLLIPTVTVVLASFAVANLLLSRLILSWIERFMAQRRTREIVGGLLAFLGLGIQLVTQLFTRNIVGHHRPIWWSYGSRLQETLPPGIAANAIALGAHAHYAAALIQYVLLLAYIAGFAMLLGIRLRAQYRGEDLGEGARRLPAAEQPKRIARSGADRFTLPDPVGAIFEKELRTLFRIRQLWMMLIAPPFMLLVFGRIGSGGSAWARSSYVFPIGAFYGLVMLANFFYDSLGGEAGGIQFLYLAPVRFRQILLAKNLAHAVVWMLQCLLLLIGVSLIFAPPQLTLLAVTFSALLFSLIVNLGVGNLMSLYYPRKIDYSQMNRQQGSSVSGLIALGVQLVIVSIVGIVFFAARYLGSMWEAIPAYLVLSAAAFAAYAAILRQTDTIATKKQEDLLAELCKTS